jgi:hypothetical protein
MTDRAVGLVRCRADHHRHVGRVGLRWFVEHGLPVNQRPPSIVGGSSNRVKVLAGHVRFARDGRSGPSQPLGQEIHATLE